MIKRLVFVLALGLASAAPVLAVATAKFALTNTSWTDLGAGPMLLTFKGNGVYAVGDTTPTIPLTEGFTMITGESFRVQTTSHVWAMAASNLGVTAYVAAY